LINRQPIESADIENLLYRQCHLPGQPTRRESAALLVQGVGVSDLHLRELESIEIEGTGPG